MVPDLNLKPFAMHLQELCVYCFSLNPRRYQPPRLRTMVSLVTTITTFSVLLLSAVGPLSCEGAATQLRASDAGSAVSMHAADLPLVPELVVAEVVAAETVNDGRSLMMKKRRHRKRGTSRSAKKKRSGKKKKSSKKKSGKKKKSSKKKSSKKSKSSSRNNRAGFSYGGRIESRSKTSVSVGGFGRSSGGYKKMGGVKSGHGTHFAAMGKPYGGCGVPPGKAFDDNGKQLPWFALNTNTEFNNGVNCGRWVEIKLGKNCVGAGNSQWSICNGGRKRPPTPPPPRASVHPLIAAVLR